MDRWDDVANIKTVLKQCGYPDWTFKTVEKKMQLDKTKKKNKNERKKNPGSTSGRFVVLPYVKGLPETTARIMKKYERTCAFKPGNTLGQQLFRCKDKSDLMKMADIVYKVQYKDCPQVCTLVKLLNHWRSG